MKSRKYSIDADFLEGQGRNLFHLLLRPTDSATRGSILFLPPFAEEMHKSRDVVASQARILAAQGYNVLLLDLTGCGDSSGDFSDATWQLWLEDAIAGVDRLTSISDAPLTLWGLRMGALLACDLAARLSHLAQLVLWQPVLNGEQHLDQFLRMRTVLTGLGDGKQFDRKSLWDELRAGHSLEIAGYELSSRMAVEMARVRLHDLCPSCEVSWHEIGRPTGAGLGIASQNVVGAWRRQGAAVTVSQVPGEPFWRIPQGGINPALEHATLKNMQSA